jgi:hypothetical protein
VWNETQIIADQKNNQNPPWDKQETRSNILNPLQKQANVFATKEPDLKSIMQYDIPRHWVLNDTNCPEPKTSGYCVEPNYDLSDTDKTVITGIYPYDTRGFKFARGVDINGSLSLDEIIPVPPGVVREGATFSERFWRLDNWSAARNLSPAFPTFNEDENKDDWDYTHAGDIYEIVILDDSIVEWHDVPTQTLEYPSTPEQRFIAVDNWQTGQVDSSGRKYSGAFPNFQQANYGDNRGEVYGVFTIKKGIAKHIDIPASTLGYPNTPEQRFRAVDRWAQDNGYAAGFPTFQQQDYGNGTVYGAVVLPDSAVKERRWISNRSLQ